MYALGSAIAHPWSRPYSSPNRVQLGIAPESDYWPKDFVTFLRSAIILEPSRGLTRSRRPITASTAIRKPRRRESAGRVTVCTGLRPGRRRQDGYNEPEKPITR